MDKNKKINNLFKVLATHDGVVNKIMTPEQWKVRVTNCLVDFLSIENKVEIDKVCISKLRGIREMYKDISHNEVKSIILGLTNAIEKE